MKINLVSTALVLAIAGSGVARAQDAAPAAAAPTTYIAAEEPVQYLAKDRLIGTKVKSPDGKIIGDIEDIILSGDHQVVGVVMGTGGYFGLFEKKVGVNVSALQFEVIDGKIDALLPSYTKDGLDAAPAFVRNQPKKSLFVRAEEKVQEIRDKTGTSAKDAYDKAKENAGPAVEKAKEAAKDAMDKVGPAIESAKQKASDVIESAKEKAGEVVEKAKEAATPAAEPAPTPAPTTEPVTAPPAAPAP